MFNDEINKIFSDSNSLRTYKQDVQSILSNVHLWDGMDFAGILFKIADCEKHFFIPEDMKPKLPVMFGTIQGIDDYISILDHIVNNQFSQSELCRLLEKVMSDKGEGLAKLITDKIIYAINQISLKKSPAYALCLLSPKHVKPISSEYDMRGILEKLNDAIVDFHYLSHCRLKELWEEHRCLLYKAEDLRRTALINRQVRCDVEHFTEGLEQVSKQIVTALLLESSLPFLKEILDNLYKYAGDLSEKIISLTQTKNDTKAKYDLSRFTKAHKASFETALSEIKNGKKETHWVWYIFPQIEGLGTSSMSLMYSIKSINEAKAFLDDEYLGKNLRSICEALLALPTNDAESIFGSIDKKKLKSSMTLFMSAAPENALFKSVLDKFFGGCQDHLTLVLLKKL